MKPAGPAPVVPGVPEPGKMRFGIAYGAGPDNTSELAALASARVGFNTARVNINWNKAQAGPDRPIDIGEEALLPLKIQGDAGLEGQILFHGSPPWASQLAGPGERGHWFDPPRLELWKPWIRALAEATRDRVTYWEIWNEPDIDFFHGTTDQYLEMLGVAYDTIKSVDPSIQVMTGGFVSMNDHGARKVGLVERVIDESQDHYDAIAYHTHGDFNRFRQEIDGNLLPYCRKVLRSPKPLYFTETGMDTRRSQDHQAQTLVKKLVFAWSRGAAGYTWFSLHDLRQTQHANQPGQTYGLYTRLDNAPAIVLRREEPDQKSVRRAVYPKAAYVAMNTLSSVLGGARYVQQIQLPTDRYAFVFAHDDGRRVIVAWNENESEAAPTHLVETDAAQAVSYDLMGNPTETRIVGNRVRLDMSLTPSFLVMHQTQTNPSVRDALVSANPAAPATMRDPVEASVELFNPFDQKVTYQVDWQPSPAFSATTPAQSVQVNPGQSRTVTGSFTPDSPQAFGLGDVLVNAMTYRIDQQGIEGRLELPVVVNASTIPVGDFDARPTLVLDKTAQVFNRFEHDPAMIDTLWGGFRDLSAHVFAASDDSADAADLNLRIRVRDDEHHPPALLTDPGDTLTVHLASGDPARTLRIHVADGQPQPLVQVVGQPDSTDTHGLTAAAVVREGLHTIYDLSVPLQKWGLTWDDLRINLVIDDDDGRPHGVETTIHAQPPRGDQHDPKDWPLLIRHLEAP